MIATVSKILLNSERDDAKLVIKWADHCAKNGGSFSVVNTYEVGAWISIVTINWPDGENVEREKK